MSFAMSSWKKCIVYDLSETCIISKILQLPPNGLPNAGCRALDAGSFRQRHRQRDAVDFEESVGLKKCLFEKFPSKVLPRFLPDALFLLWEIRK